MWHAVWIMVIAMCLITSKHKYVACCLDHGDITV